MLFAAHNVSSAADKQPQYHLMAEPAVVRPVLHHRNVTVWPASLFGLSPLSSQRCLRPCAASGWPAASCGLGRGSQQRPSSCCSRRESWGTQPPTTASVCDSTVRLHRVLSAGRTTRRPLGAYAGRRRDLCVLRAVSAVSQIRRHVRVIQRAPALVDEVAAGVFGIRQPNASIMTRKMSVLAI